MDKILIPVLIVAGIGLLAGIILAVASAIMAVPKDEKAEAILEVLPGANCGACGFSGCSGYAAALSKGEAQPGLCSPGGEACAKACAECLARATLPSRKRRRLSTAWATMTAPATKCATTASIAAPHLPCLPAVSPAAATAAWAWATAPPCANTAQSTSATAWRQSTPQVPRLRKMHRCMSEGLISFVPLKKQAVVRCSNCDKGAETMKVCKVGCIGCGKCMKRAKWAP